MNYDILIIVLIFVVPLIAQLYVMSSYNKYKKQELEKSISGFEVARKILDENGLDNVHVVENSQGGTLSDHYDPSRKVIKLSKDVFHGETVAAVSIAAHEAGHAIQDKEGYAYMRFRSIIFPVVNIVTRFSYIVLLIGLLAEVAQWFYLGIVLLIIGLIFQLVTLPVEFNASNRAKSELKKYQLINNEESEGSSKVLSAAAMTYVAGVLASAAYILRYILIFNDRRR